MSQHPTPQVRVLFLFNHPAEPDLAAIDAGEMPSERLYGFVELRDRGLHVMLCDARHRPPVFPRLSRAFLRFGWETINLDVIRKLQHSDIVLVKDDFSLSLSLVARLLGKRLVYVDSLFEFPRNPLRQALASWNIRLAHKVVAYSQRQIDLWRSRFPHGAHKFALLRYAIDVPFYQLPAASAPTVVEAPFLLSVGRDLGRDFSILLDAARQAGVRLKLITLPYLIPPAAIDDPNVEILQRISYAELFGLYRRASAVVIPLKGNLEYPSGIRAVMEGLALGCPVIATHTDILAEYFANEAGTVCYVPARDCDALVRAIQRTLDDRGASDRMAMAGHAHVARHFSLVDYASRLQELFADLDA